MACATTTRTTPCCTSARSTGSTNTSASMRGSTTCSMRISPRSRPAGARTRRAANGRRPTWTTTTTRTRRGTCGCASTSGSDPTHAPALSPPPEARSMTPRTASTPDFDRQQRRGFWLRTLHQWHWISSAVCLVGMLLFAVTGITLNHAAKIEGTPQVDNRTLVLPAPLLQSLADVPEGNAPLPAELAAWLSEALDASIGGRDAEWSGYEVYLSLPGPGRDAWL